MMSADGLLFSLSLLLNDYYMIKTQRSAALLCPSLSHNLTTHKQAAAAEAAVQDEGFDSLFIKL